MVGERDLQLAKRLARIVAEAGKAGMDGLKPALERLVDGRSVVDRKAILKAFQRALTLEIHKDTLTIESAQELDPAVVDGLVEAFSRDRQRPLIVVRKTVPDLIAGIRVRLGDSVYETSVASQLQALSVNIGQMLLYPRP